MFVNASRGGTALAERPDNGGEFDEFALDIAVVVAAHPNGKLMCSTSDGCGGTCQGGSSACSSYIEDPA
ncbi:MULTISPECIES: FxLD family lanthipeptide [unclassified Kitasatospora]|uniref:FxLD family lanthipeptide n=1 Tax=unclassified Kitasatospora TaxID=2633591 RepID=UPI0009E98624|nr:MULTISPECIES: FxLD family lanthipeptide [unclassified Kitasatospora]